MLGRELSKQKESSLRINVRKSPASESSKQCTINTMDERIKNAILRVAETGSADIFYDAAFGDDSHAKQVEEHKNAIEELLDVCGLGTNKQAVQ